jgi:hypothetical protein
MAKADLITADSRCGTARIPMKKSPVQRTGL